MSLVAQRRRPSSTHTHTYTHKNQQLHSRLSLSLFLSLFFCFGFDNFRLSFFPSSLHQKKLCGRFVDIINNLLCLCSSHCLFGRQAFTHTLNPPLWINSRPKKKINRKIKIDEKSKKKSHVKIVTPPCFFVSCLAWFAVILMQLNKIFLYFCSKFCLLASSVAVYDQKAPINSFFFFI